MNAELFLALAYALVLGGIAMYLRKLVVRSRDLETEMLKRGEPGGPPERENGL